MADHAAKLTELLGLVDERYQAALRAAIADVERLDKVERLGIDLREGHSRYWALCLNERKIGVVADDPRAAIDGVPE